MNGIFGDIGLFLLRVVMGGAMAFGHGWGKLMNFGMIAERFPDPLGLGSSFSLALAVFAEVFCAFAVMIGLGTRLAAIPLVVTMVVAFFVIHGQDPFEKKELAMMYMVAFTAIGLLGPGRFSIDAIFKKLKIFK